MPALSAGPIIENYRERPSRVHESHIFANLTTIIFLGGTKESQRIPLIFTNHDGILLYLSLFKSLGRKHLRSSAEDEKRSLLEINLQKQVTKK